MTTRDFLAIFFSIILGASLFLPMKASVDDSMTCRGVRVVNHDGNLMKCESGNEVCYMSGDSSSGNIGISCFEKR